jgi:hypothetical protein
MDQGEVAAMVARSKLERLIQALDRHTDAIERMLVANPMQIGLEGNGGCAYRKLSPSILVMQSTQDRTAQNAPRCLGGT